MSDLMDLDLYELIGTVPTATPKDIKTAYRKKALSCHPDKNPNNPKAAELFHQLSRALEILTDESAKAAYDKVLDARRQAKLRTKLLDSKRKKLKEDLEAREEAYRKSQNREESKNDEERLQAEIERLRTVGSKQVEEEVAYVQQQVMEELRKMHDGESSTKFNDPNERRVKIKWKAAKDDPQNGGYDHDTLHRILSKYGDIAILVISSNKKGRALVEYTTTAAAEMAVQLEQGVSSNPISLDWVSKPQRKVTTNVTDTSSQVPKTESLLFPLQQNSRDETINRFPSFSSAPNIFNVQSKVSDMEFEQSVLSNLRRVEERKRLIQKMQEEEQ